MKTKIVLEIENCAQCPLVRMIEVEYGYDIHCGRAHRLVAEMVEYEGELRDKTPPTWCPCRLEEK